MLDGSRAQRWPRRYVHFSAKDLEDAILELNGLKKPEEEGPKLELRICPRCSYENSPEVKRCAKCGLILDPVLAAKIAAREAKREADLKKRVEKLEKLISSLLQGSRPS